MPSTDKIADSYPARSNYHSIECYVCPTYVRFIRQVYSPANGNPWNGEGREKMGDK